MKSNNLIVKYKELPKLNPTNKVLLAMNVINDIKQHEFLEMNLLYTDSEIFAKINKYNPINYVNYYKHISDFYNNEIHNLSDNQQELFRVFKIKYKNEKDAQDAYNNFKQDKNVEYVQYDYIYKYPTYESEEPEQPANGVTKQWNIGFINANNYWELSEGDDVIVAVIDYGLNTTHLDIADNIYKKDGKIVGINYCNGGQSHEFEDDDGHGTHIAGIIGALNNNSGILGLAAKCKIMPVKVFKGKDSCSSACANGIKWAVDNGAKVINISWGGCLCTDDDYLIKERINDAFKKGVIVVCAAGNDGINVSEFFPANMDNVITVGGVNGNNSLYGNFGDKITAYAPNDLIYSLSNTTNDGIYPNSGTSFATPHVTALVALLLKINPNLTLEEIRSIIKENADTFTVKGKTITKKKINVNKTLQSLTLKFNTKMETTENQISNASFTDEYGETFSEYSCISPKGSLSGQNLNLTLKTQVQNQNYRTVAGSPYVFRVNDKNGFIHHFTDGNKAPMTGLNKDLITTFQNIDVSAWDLSKKSSQVYFYNEAEENKVDIIEKFKKILAKQTKYECFEYKILHELLNISDEMLDALNVDQFIKNFNKNSGMKPADPKQAGGVVLMF